MKRRRVSWLLLCVALVLVGCEGDRGPAGPAGTANLIYSEWYSPETWVQQIRFGIYERAYTMTTASLTQDIIDHGVVLVYMRFNGFNPQINILPVTLEDVEYRFFFRAMAGSIEVACYWYANPGTYPSDIPSANQVRYVLIPGGALDEAAAMVGVTGGELAGSLESMPYREVCSLFGIDE